MDRPTTEWVDVDRLVPHPDNPNKMSPEEFEKLEANVGENGEIPPLIVRTLELTQAFMPECEDDLLQIIDGEHRWRLAKKRGDKVVEIRVWRGITDARAKQLLLTLNRLHGKDDKAKRSRLIRDLAELEPDAEILSTILPETKAQIETMIEEVTREAVTNATSRARSLSEREPMTIFCLPDQAEVIRRAIRLAQEGMDERHQHVDCEEGEALAAISRDYLEAHEGVEA